MNPTTEEILEAYSEKLAHQISEMSDEEVRAHLADLEQGEQLAKLASDHEALGRFMHIGYKGGVEDFADLLDKHAGDKFEAIAEFEYDLAKMAAEIESAEAEIDEADFDEEETPEDVAIAAAFEADPYAMKTAALRVLQDKDIGIFTVDEYGDAVEELRLA